LLARAAVGEESVVGDIGNIHRSQPGFFSLQIIRNVPSPERAEQRLRSALADRIPIAAAQEGAEDVARAFVGPVGKHDDFLAVDGREIAARGRICLGLDDDCAIDATLLLQAGVAVIPVGAAVLQEKLERARFAGPDWRRREVGHAVLEIGHEQAVPVRRGLLGRQPVAHVNARDIALAEPQHRTRHAAINRQRAYWLAGRREHGLGDLERVFGDAGIGIKLRGLGLEFEGRPCRLALAAARITSIGRRSRGEQRGCGEEWAEAIHGANHFYFAPAVAVSAASSLARNLAGTFSNFLMQALQQNITVRSGWPACL
jgi:hypothetical protein